MSTAQLAQPASHTAQAASATACLSRSIACGSLLQRIWRECLLEALQVGDNLPVHAVRYGLGISRRHRMIQNRAWGSAQPLRAPAKVGGQHVETPGNLGAEAKALVRPQQ